jgi:uncharacterized membrane protein
MSSHKWNDQRIEIVIGILLRTGVLLAASVVAIGAFVYLAHHGHEVINYTVFHGEPGDLEGFRAIVYGALRGSGRSIIQFGLLLLIATPVVRVAFSAVGFAIERDYLYVATTLFVLAILLYSLLYA